MRKRISITAAAVLLALTSASAWAQVRQKPSSMQAPDADVTVLDNEADPNAFDPRLEIREYFRQRLPTSWWVTDPFFSTSYFSVTVHIPDNWRGNPTSAVIQLCPDRSSSVWQESLERIVVNAFYRKRPWPGVECRREHFIF